MRSRRWYRIALKGDPVPADTVSALAAAIPALTRESFVVRNPEVHCVGSAWGPEALHDGRTVRDGGVLRLIGDMLDNPRIWCELQSDDLDIHVSEDAIYLGLPPDRPTLRTSLPAEAVPESPYVEDDATELPYRPASAEYWTTIEHLLEGVDSLIMLSQWAGGLGGERWYHLQNPQDIAVVRRELVPRSILAAFSPAHFLIVGDGGTAETERLVQSEPLYGAFRWLTPAAPPRLMASAVDDDQDLLEKMKAPVRGALLLSWPETDAELKFAASPDSDAVVRASFRFG
jgi:hypothetical protein